MKREVVEFVCDNCLAPSDPIEKTKTLFDKIQVFFPIGWVGILKMTNLGPSQRLLLCTDCDKAIERALKARQRKSVHMQSDLLKNLLKGDK